MAGGAGDEAGELGIGDRAAALDDRRMRRAPPRVVEDRIRDVLPAAGIGDRDIVVIHRGIGRAEVMLAADGRSGAGRATVVSLLFPATV